MFKQLYIGKGNTKAIHGIQEQYFESNHQKLSKSQISTKRQKQKQKRNKSTSQQACHKIAVFNQAEKQQTSKDSNQALKNKFFPVIEQEQMMQDHNSKKHFQNMVYLAKMRRFGEKMRTEGVSVYSPQCLQIPEELYEEEYKGLHKFSNIAIKRLQKKCKKVSFSEFLEAKRENDWKNKAKYSVLEPEGKLSPQKNKRIGKQELYLGFSPSCEINQNNHEDIYRHNKSMNIYEAKRAQGKLRLLKCKTRERYSSIPHISPTLEMKLQISRVNLHHPE